MQHSIGRACIDSAEPWFKRLFAYTLPRTVEWGRTLRGFLESARPEVLVGSAAYTYMTQFPYHVARETGIPSLALSHTFVPGSNCRVAADRHVPTGSAGVPARMTRPRATSSGHRWERGRPRPHDLRTRVSRGSESLHDVEDQGSIRLALVSYGLTHAGVPARMTRPRATAGSAGVLARMIRPRVTAGSAGVLARMIRPRVTAGSAGVLARMI
jgi:hypothetical protein